MLVRLILILIEKKLRGYVSINVQSGEALDTHSFATLNWCWGYHRLILIWHSIACIKGMKKSYLVKFSFDECVLIDISQSVNAWSFKDYV